MKNIKLRLLALAILACMSFSLTACGGNGGESSEGSTTSVSEAAGDSSPDETSTGEISTDDTADEMTLEDYFNSEEMQAVIDLLKESYSEQGITADLYAKGDDLMYDFTMNDVVLTDEEIETYAETLKSSTAANADQYRDTASQAKDAVTNEVVNVVLTFMDAEGKVIYSEVFSSEDAVAAAE